MQTLATGARPLSSAQERAWFLDQIELNSTNWALAAAWRLVGDLNIEALERALNTVLERHQVLRTTYSLIDGAPRQIVSPGVTLRIEHVDLRPRNLSPDHPEILRCMSEVAWRPYDLAQDLMVRASLMRLADQEWILVLGRHHIATDAGSNRTLFGELSQSYNASIENRTLDLPPLLNQYADYAADERAWFASPEYAVSLAYWKRTLAGVPHAFEVPTDFVRPDRMSARGGVESMLLPQELRAALTTIGRTEGCTLFMVVLSAYLLLLSRLTGETDVRTGCTAANRQDSRFEELVGFFVNTLVLRADLSTISTFRELLVRVRGLALEAYNHQRVPFDHVVNALQVERDLSRNPLLDVLINYVYLGREHLELKGVEATALDIPDHPARLGLTLYITPVPEGLRTRIVYQRALYAPERMRALLEQFQALLVQIAENPGLPIAGYRVEQGSPIPAEWNATAAPYPRDKTIHQLFEAQAQRTPDAAAVVCEDRTLTYRELDVAANRLAHVLREKGVGPERLVGLTLERSVHMMVALLGVLKAGGAYVPLDPRHPRAWLAERIAEANLQLVLTAERSGVNLPVEICPVLRLDRDRAMIDAFPDAAPTNAAHAENAAYVLFTSGSTGKPKGVVIEHRAVVNYITGVSSTLGLDKLTGFGLLQPLTVDASVTTIFAPWFHGGCLYVVPEELALDVRGLAAYFRRHPIDYLKIAPAHLAALHAAGGEGVMPRRLLLLGGEASRWEAVRRYQALAPQCVIFNHYGPTEATVGVTTFRVPADAAASGMVPIGRPLPNTAAYILDEKMRPVPVGAIGELHLAGDCLARGYLNQAAFTDEVFVPHPFDARPGERVYKTGDLARYLPDGDIEFLGRADSQVKIRGARVETGEVEAAIGRHPDVADAAVTAEESDSGARLVAYIVRRQGAVPTDGDVRAFLERSVPAHLVPAAIAFVDSLPRMSHGKLDRAALRNIAVNAPLAEPATAGAKDALETRLVRIWEGVLKVRPIGTRDNFFALGGHSLLAVSLLARIEGMFERRLPLRVLFEAPTIEQLAIVLRREGWSSRWASLVPIQTSGRQLPLYCVHGARGNVLFYADLARHLAGERPVYGLQSIGVDGTCDPLGSVGEMAAAYIREIKDVQPEGPYLLSGFCAGAYVALEMAHQMEQAGDRVALLISFATDGTWRTVESFGGGLLYHWANVRSLGLREKAAYILGRFRFRGVSAMGAAVEWVCGYYRRSGKPLPRFLHPLFVEQANRRAVRQYKPRPYGGGLVYLQGADEPFRDPAPFWGSLVGSIATALAPGSGMSIFREPHAAALARRLTEQLRPAEAAREPVGSADQPPPRT